MFTKLTVKKVALVATIAFVPSLVSGGFFSDADEEAPNVPVTDKSGWSDYGVDVSFPIHHAHVSSNFAWLEHNTDPDVEVPEEYQEMPIQPLGDRNEFYRDFLQGCREAFGNRGARCAQTEIDRIEMSLRQPQSMENYTEVGFKKIRAPDHVWELIQEFWKKNKDKSKPENWGVGNTYTNNWEAPTTMVSVEDKSLRGGGHTLKQAIWTAARDTIEEWTGQELTQCSLYGIRTYHAGSVLATHVDRLPLVSSAIINVAQDLDEPWPLEVYGHDGRATNVTMEPGDMVLYESHSVLHGRPFPLKGRYMANIFIHFEPTGHSLRHDAKMEMQNVDVHEKYRDTLKRGVGGHESDHSGLPPYVVPGTPEEDHWRRSHPNGYKSKRNSSVTGSTSAHRAAQGGDLERLKEVVSNNKGVVNASDSNGWTPLHEGVRGGNADVVKFLVENGADVNQRTGSSGGSALWWAKQSHRPDDPIIELLESLGALEIGPDL